MCAFSLDLRHRIIAALDAGQSVPVVAGRFSVAQRTVRRYRQRWRDQGTLDPQPRPGRQRTIRGADEGRLREQVLAAPDATLRERREQWHARTGVWVSESTLCRALHRLQLTVKKAPDCQRTGS
jgi:transposase